MLLRGVLSFQQGSQKDSQKVPCRGFKGSQKGFLEGVFRKDAAFFTVASFLLTVEFFCLQLCSGTFPLTI